MEEGKFKGEIGFGSNDIFLTIIKDAQATLARGEPFQKNFFAGDAQQIAASFVEDEELQKIIGKRVTSVGLDGEITILEGVLHLPIKAQGVDIGIPFMPRIDVPFGLDILMHEEELQIRATGSFASKIQGLLDKQPIQIDRFIASKVLPSFPQNTELSLKIVDDHIELLIQKKPEEGDKGRIEEVVQGSPEPKEEPDLKKQ